jgi:diguanylate cyclase (GGDEF)-like protein
MRDVTEASLAAQETAYQATHDSLTGLLNRREFERRLTLMLKHAKDQERQHALCYIDLDQFKVVNDTCGHSAGDELLGQLSALLKSRLRDRDTLARLGGDEFGVILGECPLDQALRIANELREIIQDYRYSWGTRLFRIGASIGVVPITCACADPAYVLSAADNACYAAKEQGRNRVHVFEPGSTDLVRRQSEMQWIPRLHHALAENQFRLYVQPIIPLNAAGNQIHGEVLMRLRDDTGEQYLPGAFIPAAERFHQMLAIDRWVVRAALAALGQCCPAQSTFSINLSGQSVGNVEFLDFVMKELACARVASERICFEITETAAISNLTGALNFISTLKARGCRFALDDFGSGLSSFAYLKTLPVDYLKIDGRFIRDVHRDPVDREMVEAIHRVAHLMGIETVAECVENDALLEPLKAIGIDYVQGFAIGGVAPLGEALLGGNWSGTATVQMRVIRSCS